MSGEHPTDDGCQDHNHPHHDAVGVHESNRGRRGFMPWDKRRPAAGKQEANIEEWEAPLLVMGTEASWQQAPENTLESLRHAIQHLDGVEFDIRITHDQQLVIHHDRTVSIPKEHLDGRDRWVEAWTLEELEEVGFLGFERFLCDPVVKDHWVNHGKMGTVEIKRPHPTAPMGGGYLGKNSHIDHIARAMTMADELLSEHEVPHENMVFYSFHKHMPASAKRSGTTRPWAALIPYIRPYGGRRIERLLTLPTFLTTSFKRLRTTHLKQGSSMLPCAMEYFQDSTAWLPIGRSVGLHGAALNRLHRARAGMPTYVWPARPQHEHNLLRAGLTALTDMADPNITTLASGHARWVQPATRPLTESQWLRLEAEPEHLHGEKIDELLAEVPSWAEADRSRRATLIEEWRKQWQWSTSTDELLKRFDGATPPVAAPRLIGHRGSGKTSRPVLTTLHSR
ncbi:MAG: hypothetical protein DWC07_00105 [Candidatus Poseidoniales archaeon]|nr:MAG: hypothetical protein DWC07_00105 [Candidatus Poseidoniales archaeon]